MRKSLDVLISPKRLSLLEQKERAHDDYLTALRVMRAQAARRELAAKADMNDQLFVRGYRAALKDFAWAICQAAESRHAR
jgi:hypothetical protein